MARYVIKRQSPGLFAILFHILMTCLTGGLWLLGLFIWHLLKK